MAITKTEFLTDRLRMHYCCERPWGTTDENEVLEVPYNEITGLPGVPLDHGHGEFRAVRLEQVYIPACKTTICFRFATWQETDDCRMEGLVGGPYLAPAAGPVQIAAS